MKRRDLLLLAATSLGLAACGSVPVKIELPASLQQLTDDANSIVNKLSSLSSLLPASAAGLLDKAKQLIASLSAGGSVGGIVSELLPALQQLAGFLPTTGTTGTVVAAVETLLPVIAKVAGIAFGAGRRMSATMSVEQARAILRT